MNTMDDYLLSDVSRFIGKLHSAVEEFEFRETDHDSLLRVLNKLRSAIKDVEVLYLLENTRANAAVMAAERALRTK